MFSRVIHVLHLLVFLNETSQVQIFLPLIVELSKIKIKIKIKVICVCGNSTALD